MGLFHISTLFFYSHVCLYPVLNLSKNTDELSRSEVATAWCPAPLHSRWTEKMHFAILTGGRGGPWLGTYNRRQIHKREQTDLSMGVSCDTGASRTKDPKGKKVNVVLVRFCFWNRSSAYNPDAFKLAILWPLLAKSWGHTCVLPCRLLC